MLVTHRHDTQILKYLLFGPLKKIFNTFCLRYSEIYRSSCGLDLLNFLLDWVIKPSQYLPNEGKKINSRWCFLSQKTLVSLHKSMHLFINAYVFTKGILGNRSLKWVIEIPLPVHQISCFTGLFLRCEICISKKHALCRWIIPPWASQVNW